MRSLTVFFFSFKDGSLSDVNRVGGDVHVHMHGLHVGTPHVQKKKNVRFQEPHTLRFERLPSVEAEPTRKSRSGREIKLPKRYID